MKKITMMLALAAAMVAQSCQKDDLSGQGGPDPNAKVAYVSLAISTPTRAAGTDGEKLDGTEAESSVTKLALMTFSKSYDYLSTEEVTVSDVAKTFVCPVSPDARRFFAVVNPPQAFLDQFSKLTSLTQAEFEKLPAIALLDDVDADGIGEVTTNNASGFTMVNCGTMNKDGILLEALVSVDVDKLGTTADDATSVPISVERLASKFQYTVSDQFDHNTNTQFDSASPKNAVGEVVGIALTARNKAVHPYTKIMINTLTGNNVYRMDHNMKVGEGLTEAVDLIPELKANFHWLKNMDPATDGAFIGTTTNSSSEIVGDGVEYVLENTCDAGITWNTSNNLTQAIVKAQYNPTMTNGAVLPLGTSWFKIYTTTGDGTLYLTFDEVVALYNGTYNDKAGDPVILSAAVKASMDLQLNWILDDTGRTWNDGVTLKQLEDCSDYGGYLAATVGSTDDNNIGNSDDYIVQFYRKAINYYNVFIQHDEDQVSGSVGRWGMVRNNSYTMDVTGILKEGLPYIPDPTDPKVVDPERLKPEDPEPADDVEAYVKVEITVKPWVMWYQSSPLK